MNVVHISPHFPEHYGLFTQRLVKYGARVFGITDRYDHELPDIIKGYLTCNYKVDSLHNTSQVLQACRHFQQNCGKIDHVESHLESWIELEAAIREAFDLDGLRPGDIAFIKRKSLMKQIFARANVPSPKGAIVESFSQCKNFISNSYPVFIKPDSGVGANNTYTINNEADLKSFFENLNHDITYYIEEYLLGEIESFDGLADRDGEIVFCTAHKFNHDIHKIVKNNLNLAYYNYREIPSDLESMGRQIVNVLKVKAKFFHIEFFRLPDGKIKALEINLRPPGGLTTHMFNYSCDIDLYDWWAAIVVNNAKKFNYERKYFCAYIGRKYDRSYKFSEQQIREKFGNKIVHSQSNYPIEYSVMGHYGFIARSEYEEEIKDIINTILQET